MASDAPNLSRLIEMAKSVRMSEVQVAEQRNSFVYGNTRTENPTITRALVEQTAKMIDEGKRQVVEKPR